MPFELKYKGEKLSLKVSSEEVSVKELHSLLGAIGKLDKQISEPVLRERVVKQLKQEIFQDAEVEDVIANWWQLPSDFLKSGEAARFISMEADLNSAVQYEKIPFSLPLLVDEKGKQYGFDRKELQKSMSKIPMHEYTRNSNAVLIRLKANVKASVKAEIEDFMRSILGLERVQFVYEKKKYEGRASLELVFFGEFPDQ